MWTQGKDEVKAGSATLSLVNSRCGATLLMMPCFYYYFYIWLVLCKAPATSRVTTGLSAGKGRTDQLIIYIERFVLALRRLSSAATPGVLRSRRRRLLARCHRRGRRRGAPRRRPGARRGRHAGGGAPGARRAGGAAARLRRRRHGGAGVDGCRAACGERRRRRERDTRGGGADGGGGPGAAGHAAAADARVLREAAGVRGGRGAGARRGGGAGAAPEAAEPGAVSEDGEGGGRGVLREAAAARARGAGAARARARRRGAATGGGVRGVAGARVRARVGCEGGSAEGEPGHDGVVLRGLCGHGGAEAGLGPLPRGSPAQGANEPLRVGRLPGQVHEVRAAQEDRGGHPAPARHAGQGEAAGVVRQRRPRSGGRGRWGAAGAVVVAGRRAREHRREQRAEGVGAYVDGC
eukprot:Rhum_TRINITY_DN14774_c4_g1::Rhum_TRINITY_DN14774_c4_g1_i1::g.116265::m.116265